jgi:GDP-L-fucose synthase
MTKISKESKIYIAGHRGMVGSACWRLFESKGYTNLIGRTSEELDLRDQKAVAEFFQKEQPNAVIDAAAKVGGILANDTYPYEFLLYNMQIQNNLIQSAHQYDVKKFIFLGSTCIYPKEAPQPIKETDLLTGSLESTNQWYAIAKISGLKLCQAINKQFAKNFISLMPTNLYGPGDNYDLETSHVLPALIRKFHEAKIDNHAPVKLWGTGKPLREFLHVDDLASAVFFVMNTPVKHDLLNVGSGEEISIVDLARLIQKTVGHQGDILWDHTKPDGTFRKLSDTVRLNELGWKSSISLKKGVRSTYKMYLKMATHQV